MVEILCTLLHTLDSLLVRSSNSFRNLVLRVITLNACLSTFSVPGFSYQTVRLHHTGSTLSM